MQNLKVDKTINIGLPQYKLYKYEMMLGKLKKEKLPRHQSFKQVLEELKR